MKFYWCANTRAFRIAWLLEEAGVRYERIVIDIRDAAAKGDPAFRAASPMGKVPALEDGAARLSDSGAICIYVADQYPKAGLAPPVGHPDRARFLQWVTFTNSVIEPAMAEKFAKLEPRPSSFGWGGFDLMQAILRSELSRGEWILGERFCAADVLLGTSAFYLKQFGLIEDDPVLGAYAARCQARPAWQRAKAFDAAPQ
ncbi:MAG: glutathione S-transferase family protein [Steroidobacteraceae bacterium]